MRPSLGAKIESLTGRKVAPILSTRVVVAAVVGKGMYCAFQYGGGGALDDELELEPDDEGSLGPFGYSARPPVALTRPGTVDVPSPKSGMLL